MTKCNANNCAEAATAAIATQRPTRANLWTKVWWEESEAPARAERLCGPHLKETLVQLAEVLV